MNLFLLEKQNYVNKQNIKKQIGAREGFLLLFLFSIHRGLNTVLIIAHFIYILYMLLQNVHMEIILDLLPTENKKTVPPLRGCVNIPQWLAPHLL